VKQLFPSCVWSFKDTNEKCIYLTFDDGPIQEVTPWVLKTLETYDARATFFCIGKNVKNNTGIYQDILRAGHSVGNHTNTHLNGWKSLYKQYLNDVVQCSTVVNSGLFRPPYGKLKPLQLRTLRKNFNIIMWSYLTGDYNPQLNCDKVFAEMQQKVTSGDIIVFHDSLKAEANMKYLLPKVLEYYSKEGYQFRRIEQQVIKSKSQ
jgi:peptidoglycan/xylan/chitin deacetylase (PgdA/CDA1 family)